MRFYGLTYNMTSKMDIAKQIKQQAKQHGLTTQMLADKLGIARQVLSSQINGNPTITTLGKIADAIGCDVKDFFTGDDDNSRDRIIIICPHCGEKLVFSRSK